MGLQDTDLIILAARPAMGKTAFSLNVALNAARSGAGVLLFSLEMGVDQLVQRLLAIESGVELTKIQEDSSAQRSGLNWLMGRRSSRS